MKRKSRRSATTSYHPRELTWIPKNDGPWKRWTPGSKMAIFFGIYILIYVSMLDFWGISRVLEFWDVGQDSSEVDKDDKGRCFGTV